MSFGACLLATLSAAEQALSIATASVAALADIPKTDAGSFSRDIAESPRGGIIMLRGQVGEARSAATTRYSESPPTFSAINWVPAA